MTRKEILQRRAQLLLQAAALILEECQTKIQDAGRVLNECQNLFEQIKDDDDKL